MKHLSAVALSLLFTIFAVAQDKVPPRVVRVVGAAELKVVPDRAIIEVGVEKQNVSATVAKHLADGAARTILATLRAHGIDEKDVQTTYLSLQPQFNYRRGMRISYFIAEQTLTITVRDLPKLDSLLEALIKAGGNRIDSIEYATSDLRKYRDQARDLAIKAAREKAEALAQALGQSAGKAYSIEEVPETTYGPGVLGNVGFETASKLRSPTGPATAAGQRTVTASVTVSFDLN